MKRRRLLQLGLGATALLAVGGGALALLEPGWRDGRLTGPGRAVFRAVAGAVLEGVLPAAPASARAAALDAHLARLDDTLAALPPSMQQELAQALGLLASPFGRRTIAGLSAPWEQASVADVAAALHAMRLSTLSLRQQLYHALRDLTNAACFADPANWRALRYPGPATV